MGCFFLSSRRRHTRCALVTGVQTCALPIYAASAAARRGLEQDGITDLPCDAQRLRLAVDRAVGAGNHRKAELLRRLLRADLVAHQPDVLRRWADEGEAVLLDHFREAEIGRAHV